jgi:hypothetical protein
MFYPRTLASVRLSSAISSAVPQEHRWLCESFDLACRAVVTVLCRFFRGVRLGSGPFRRPSGIEALSATRDEG